MSDSDTFVAACVECGVAEIGGPDLAQPRRSCSECGAGEVRLVGRYSQRDAFRGNWERDRPRTPRELAAISERAASLVLDAGRAVAEATDAVFEQEARGIRECFEDADMHIGEAQRLLADYHADRDNQLALVAAAVEREKVERAARPQRVPRRKRSPAAPPAA